MPYTQVGWEDEIPGSTPVKYVITGDVEGVISASAQIEVLTPITPGTPLNAANLQQMDDGISLAVSVAEAAIPKSLATLVGQLLYSSGAGTWLALAMGGVGNALKKLQINAAGTAPEWVGASVARVSKTSQSIPNTTITVISNDTESYDTSNYYDPVAPTFLTAPYTGLYLITYWVSFAANGTGYRAARVLLNSAAVQIEDKQNATNGDVTSMNIAMIVKLTAGQTLSIDVYQNSGGALLTTAISVIHFLGQG